MTLRIDYQSRSFPPSYGVRSGTLTTTWSELLWAAITIGRPSTYHVFRHGPPSFHEAIFRLSLIRMAIQQDWNGYLRRTDAFSALDPTEKGMVSYFLGMTLTKLFASRILYTPWLLHLDVFQAHLSATTLGRSRPDLVGQSVSGEWHAFESKGRSSAPSSEDKDKAKTQAQRLISVNSARCHLHVGSFSFFRRDLLEFYWRDPDPDVESPIKLPHPDQEWQYYFEPSLSLASEIESTALDAERALADVKVEVHPALRELLSVGEWSRGQARAGELRTVFQEQGYQIDGIKVVAGDTWRQPRPRLEGGVG